MFRFASLVVADALAPALGRWSLTRQKQILRVGKPLPREAIKFAGQLGIEAPEDLRIELTDSIPFPVPPLLVHGAKTLGCPVFQPAGMCLGRGICAVSTDPDLLRHELVHTAQYQRLGSHQAFMWRYLYECARFGYYDAPLELEARERALHD